MCSIEKGIKQICACILVMLLCGCAQNEKLPNETVSTKDASGISFLEEDEAAWMDAVAPPVLIIKPACFSLTCAPPTLKPFRPARSISAPAKWPSGRLNVLPADG